MELCRHREAHGPFTNIADLIKVNKVGPKSQAAICEILKGDGTGRHTEKKSRPIVKSKDFRLFTPDLTPAFLEVSSDLKTLNGFLAVGLWSCIC